MRERQKRENVSVSYPMAMRVPSLSTVMSMSMSTGMWKNSGQSRKSYGIIRMRPVEYSEQ